jgi:spermidine synthase
MTKLGELDFYAAMNHTLQAVFPFVGPYQSFIPCFGTPWGFAVCGKRDDPGALTPAAIDRRVAERVTGPLRFYDGLAHQHMLSLPVFLRKVVADCTRVITDAEPLIVG